MEEGQPLPRRHCLAATDTWERLENHFTEEDVVERWSACEEVLG